MNMADMKRVMVVEDDGANNVGLGREVSGDRFPGKVFGGQVPRGSFRERNLGIEVSESEVSESEVSGGEVSAKRPRRGIFARTPRWEVRGGSIVELEFWGLRSGKKRQTPFGVRAGRRDDQATARQWCHALRSACQIWCQAVRFAAEKRGAGHYANQKVVPGTTVTAKTVVPGTAVLPAGPRTDTTPIVDCAIRQYRYFPGACSPLLAHHRSEKPQREAQKTNYWVLQATTDKTLSPQPLAGC
ncbi:MAG: hypothetical protein KatS3mg110_4220 [Pirellulaceae bacterium]|nr:MAG: hypothetical protein KatS3mg110_4220 [Pirellulaceae bacterium]